MGGGVRWGGCSGGDVHNVRLTDSCLPNHTHTLSPPPPQKKQKQKQAYSIFSWLSSGLMDGIPTTILDDFPKVIFHLVISGGRAAASIYVYGEHWVLSCLHACMHPPHKHTTTPNDNDNNDTPQTHTHTYHQIRALIAKVGAHPKVAAWNEAHGQK